MLLLENQFTLKKTQTFDYIIESQQIYSNIWLYYRVWQEMRLKKGIREIEWNRMNSDKKCIHQEHQSYTHDLQLKSYQLTNILNSFLGNIH